MLTDMDHPWVKEVQDIAVLPQEDVSVLPGRRAALMLPMLLKSQDCLPAASVLEEEQRVMHMR